MSKTTHIRTARKGETSRPLICFMGRFYETLAAPTFIVAGQKVRVQEMPPAFGARKNAPKRIVVAPLDKEGWETWEEE